VRPSVRDERVRAEPLELLADVARGVIRSSATASCSRLPPSEAPFMTGSACRSTSASDDA
jgi:hypothetical protein